MRLDQYVAQHFPEYSRSTWQKYIESGYVKVNGDVVTTTKHGLGVDDKVTFDIPEKIDFSKQELPITYEDDNVFVIDKPVACSVTAKAL